MESFSSGRIRNVILLSHSGTGKTSLVEALLYACKGISRLGRVEDGNTTSDYEPEEIKRSSSTNTSLAPALWKNHKITLIDTPGYADFVGEVVSGLRVADAAILTIAAPVGVEIGTEQMWKLLENRRLPRFVVINKMDRENADFDRSLESIQQVLGKQCVAINLPQGSANEFEGTVELLSNQVIPPGMQARVDLARDQLIEAVAETDDVLATKYLEEDELTEEEIHEGLRLGILSGAIVPVLATSATENLGIEALLDNIVAYLPSPQEAPKDPSLEKLNGGNGLVAFVFKTTADPYVGKLSYFRLYQGTLTSDSQVWNANKQQSERVGQIFVPKGKSQEQVSQLQEGDIGAVARLAVTETGNTLCQKEHPVQLEGIHFSEPVFTMAVYPKSKQDLDKMTTSLARLVDEDPSLRMVREMETAETLLSGQGDTHLEVATEKAKRKFGVELALQLPRVAYRETITRTTKTEYKHKKQSGGHGQYGHVLLELEPAPRGAGFEFGSRVVGGSVPREYIPAVEKGVSKVLQEGVVAGYPVVDLKVTLYDGSFHPVDSSGMSFEIAGSFALRKGVGDGGPALLEPIFRLDISAPDSYAGEVMGDVNGKRGKILGMNPQREGITLIEAEAPLAELLRYATDLRSITQSRGTFNMTFSHYDEVPQHLVSRITQEAKRDREETKI
jgi:elongation factor G